MSSLYTGKDTQFIDLSDDEKIACLTSDPDVNLVSVPMFRIIVSIMKMRKEKK